MAEGIETVRTLDSACEQRALRKAELTHILAKEGLRGFAKSVDRKAAPLSEIDLVGIHLEDLFL